MSFSLSWLSLTNITTVASVQLLVICIGLPSETYPAKSLGCIQGVSGTVSLAGGKMKTVLWIVSFLITETSFPCPLSVEKPREALNFCSLLHCQFQPSSSQEMTAVKVEWVCFHSLAFSSLGCRGGGAGSHHHHTWQKAPMCAKLFSNPNCQFRTFLTALFAAD